MAYRIGIIGGSLRHSISPFFQQAALHHAGIAATFEVWETDERGLAPLLRWLREMPEALGANVTVPHKEAAFAEMDQIAPSAEPVGAINTVVASGGRLTGHNTDVAGFLRPLRTESGFEPGGKRVLVLGAGGAARAVVVALSQERISGLTIANRDVARAERLAEQGRALQVPTVAIPLTEGAIRGAGTAWDLVVNATAVGMRYSPFEHAIPMAESLIHPGVLVYDLVYNPPVTPLLAAAQRRGAQTLSGLLMLVYQGADAFSLWTGGEAPLDVMREAAERALTGPSQRRP